MGQDVALITVSGTFASHSASSHGDARMHSLERKLFLTLHYFCKILDTGFDCSSPHTELEGQSTEHDPNKHQHGQVTRRHASNKHDEHTGEKQKYRRRHIGQGNQTAYDAAPE